MRNSTMPQPIGKSDVLASSPKSLSKVSRTRRSRAAHANTTSSLTPGAIRLTQAISCAAASRAATAAPGKFSLARKRISSCARKYLFRAQHIAGIGETGGNVFMRDARIIRQDLGLAPSVGHQSDHEFDRQPSTLDDWLADKHLGIHRNAGMTWQHGLALWVRLDQFAAASSPA